MPPSTAPSLTRRALVAVAVTSGIVVGGFGVASAQEPVPTTVPSTILVPGSTAPTTTPASTTTTTEPDSAEDDNSFFDTDFDANEKVWIIVGGLVAIAIVMLVLTVIYWRHTKPERPKQDRHIERSERREEKADRKDEKRRRKAADRDPFAGHDDGPDDEPADQPGGDDDDEPEASSGPMDLDGLLARPDPSRSVFGTPEDDDPSR